MSSSLQKKHLQVGYMFVASTSVLWEVGGGEANLRTNVCMASMTYTVYVLL